MHVIRTPAPLHRRIARRLANRLYYSAWPVLIGWNPTRLCNWLADHRIHMTGERYDAYGGARWLDVYQPVTD